MTFRRHVSNQLRTIYLKSWRQELSIGIYMSRIRRGGKGSPDVVVVFWGGLHFILATSTEF